MMVELQCTQLSKSKLHARWFPGIGCSAHKAKVDMDFLVECQLGLVLEIKEREKKKHF